MIKIIDAHMHFRHDASNPAEDLCEQIKRCGLDGCVLILNTDEDKAIYQRNKDFIHSSNSTIFVSYLFNVTKDDVTSQLWKDTVNIKIHPRFSNITSADFQNYTKALERSSARVITVDSFLYGHRIHTHVGTELAIYLAEHFPDKSVVIAHSGGADLLRTVMITKTLNNIYYDLSLTCNYLWDSSIRLDMVQLVKFHSGRVLFGSDYPDFTPAQAMKRMNSICKKAGLSESEQQMIMGMNVLGIYMRA